MKNIFISLCLTFGLTTLVSAEGIGFEHGVVRRDPSDVIKVGKKYYVYYTKMVRAVEAKRARELKIPLTYPEGYHGDVYMAVSEDQGHTWNELGAAVTRGEQGTFDCNSCLTPNILVYKKKYYLYYTAVGTGFTNRGFEDKNRTVIGLAVSNSPSGPFKKLKKPVLESSRDNSKFDSYRVDDSCLRIVNGNIYLYYKGRSWENSHKNTKIGYAIAKNPLGPYVRANNGEPIQQSGHEVLVWQFGKSFYSFVHKGHGKNSGTFRKADDGLDFDGKGAIISKSPSLHAPGLFRPEISGQKLDTNPIRWGIEMDRRRSISLKRFELDMRKVDPSLKK